MDKLDFMIGELQTQNDYLRSIASCLQFFAVVLVGVIAAFIWSVIPFEWLGQLALMIWTEMGQ